jgi:fructosamine-3-kinase
MDRKAIFAAVSQQTGMQLRANTAREVGGGDIHRAYRLDSDSGPVFLKLNVAARMEQLLAESAGLQMLTDAGVVRVPAVIDCGEASGWAYLLMEWMDLSGGGPACSSRLGAALAALHTCTAPSFGLGRDNFIGASPQPNGWSRSWVEFFRDRRLGFQLRLAASKGMPDLEKQGQQLLRVMDGLFRDYQPVASLLHGDLWAGNWGCLDSGEPAIFDPAVYYGDRETDLAMTRLFGGFDGAFYQAYERAWPLAPGWQLRGELYQLYHVLNHANIFGGAYAGDAARRMQGLLGQLE